jgi:hypothetical protein
MLMGLSRSAFSADATAGMNAKAQAVKKAANEVKARKLLVRLYGILTMPNTPLARCLH